MKNPKLVIGIIVIVVLLIIFFAVLANAKTTTVTKSGEVVTQPSLLDSVTNFFYPRGTSTDLTGGSKSQFCKIFPKLCGQKKYCDCKNPGYTSDGDLSPLCTEGIGSEWSKSC